MSLLLSTSVIDPVVAGETGGVKRARSALFDYDVKVVLSAAPSCWRIGEAYGDDTVSECTARHFSRSSGCDEPLSCPRFLVDMPLKTAIEDNNSSDKLPERIQLSDNKYQSSLHCIGKAYNLSK